MSEARSAVAFFTGPGASERSTITVLALMVSPPVSFDFCAAAGPTASVAANKTRIWRCMFSSLSTLCGYGTGTSVTGHSEMGKLAELGQHAGNDKTVIA